MNFLPKEVTFCFIAIWLVLILYWTIEAIVNFIKSSAFQKKMKKCGEVCGDILCNIFEFFLYAWPIWTLLLILIIPIILVFSCGY